MARPRSVKAFIGITALAAVWLVGVAAATSDIGLALPAFVAAFYSGAALLLAWLVVAIIFRQGVRTPWAVAAPLALAFGALLTQLDCSSNPIFRLRFLASRPSFARVAEAVLVSAPPAAPRRIGLFLVDRVEVTPGQARFLSACEFIDTCGILYAPVGRPRQRPGEVLRPLGGPWYYLWQRW